MRFKGTFNWMGTSYILYTNGANRTRAFNNFLHQIVKKVNHPYHYVFRYFMSGKDNYLIEEDKHGSGRKRKNRKIASTDSRG